LKVLARQIRFLFHGNRALIVRQLGPTEETFAKVGK
jgi:hypothetical protein